MKKILVLGATSGIGEALACEAKRQGWMTGATGRREALLRADVVRAFDLTAPDATIHLQAILDEMGGADVIVFNAGYGHQSEQPDETTVNQTLALNVVAFTHIAHFAYTRCAHFVAVASIAGIRGLENTNGYAPSKAYMINMMEGLRRKAYHEHHPILLTTIQPGFVDTALGQSSTFWRCTPLKAAQCLLKAIDQRKAVAYVTPRWRIIAYILQYVPRAWFERIPL